MQSQAAAFIRDSAKADGILRPSGERALLIDGRAAADRLLEKVRSEAETLLRRGIKPGLATVLVGDDPASQVYVGSKAQGGARMRLSFRAAHLAASTSEADLLALVRQLNADPRSTASSCSCRCRKPSTPTRVIQAIAPEKDVDGFHPRQCRQARHRRAGARLRALHAGRRAAPDRARPRQGARPRLRRRSLIVGRSNIVGKPMAHLLLAGQRHRHHRPLPHERSAGAGRARADILVAAVGRPEMIRGDWVKPGATVIDVGINRVPAPDTGERRRRGWSAMSPSPRP